MKAQNPTHSVTFTPCGKSQSVLEKKFGTKWYVFEEGEMSNMKIRAILKQKIFLRIFVYFGARGHKLGYITNKYITMAENIYYYYLFFQNRDN